jgi:hypothetical protein
MLTRRTLALSIGLAGALLLVGRLRAQSSPAPPVVTLTQWQAIAQATFWLQRGRTFDADFTTRQICVTHVISRKGEWWVPLVQATERGPLYSHRYLSVEKTLENVEVGLCGGPAPGTRACALEAVI